MGTEANGPGSCLGTVKPRPVQYRPEPGSDLVDDGATEPWAILRRHPLDPEVPEDSVDPCLVMGSRNRTWDRESPVQRVKSRFLSYRGSLCSDAPDAASQGQWRQGGKRCSR